MKISIIVPVYNSEKYLERLLNSILVQTYQDYEVVLVNDGSTDRSLEIINSFASNNNKINCITIKNSGPGVARRIGFENAKGDLLFFIDSDDYIPNTKSLEKIANIYSEFKFDILFFDFIRKCNGIESIVNGLETTKLNEGMHDNRFFYCNQVAGALWCKIFVKNKMKKDYFSEYNNYEDYYTTYRYLEKCNNFYYTKEICYFANRDNETSISKIVNEKKIYNTVNLLKEIYSLTRYKEAVSTIIYDYYVCIRRKIDRNIYSDKSSKVLMKLKELKKYFNFKNLIKTKQSLKRLMIYVYYILKDIINRGK